MNDTKDADSSDHKMTLPATLDTLSLPNGCAIGEPGGWPRGLQDTVTFVLSLTHPSAIFMGDDLVMLHNKAWRDMLGSSVQQGNSQNEALSDHTVKTLQSAVGGHYEGTLAAVDFAHQPRMDIEHSPVLCSPIRFGDWKGVVVQVLCQETGIDVYEKNADEDMALDRQPFFQKFAEMLPTGLALLDHEAEALFVNHAFHKLTVHGGLDKSFKKWPKTIHPEDYERVMTAYREAFEARSNLSTEFRAHGMNSPWRLFLMRPIGDKDIQHSRLKRHGGFICAVVDITSIKAAELSQQKIARDAQERKTQQERFIDMISHEIRNPLSAVLHCQEDVLEAVQKENIPVAEIIEACETIALCVSHQKTLVDDILSFSKLDASMLSLVPRVTQPKWQMSESLKIFQPELRKRQIEFDYKIDPSYEKIEIGQVMADLVRISQVLVNLMSNAIKFTARKDGEKKISVDVGASITRPTSYPPDVVFFGSEEQVNTMDSTQSSDWGNGEALYILVAIRDTGIGINKENQEKLFDRFRQATPKTEEMYGGSGLGLNISRKICQLHGGEIGVSSKEGSGSTFGFFYRVRRCEDQDKGDSMNPDELRNSLKIPDDYTQGPTSDKDEPDTLTDPRVEATSNADDRWQNTEAITSDMRNDKTMKVNKPEKVDKPEKGAHRDEFTLKVLFVEDNLINQRILKRKMQAKGFEVITANNGKEAVDAFRSAASTESKAPAFDCVLMDQEMPVMDGNHATRAIRDIESKDCLPRIRIIGVTANVREEQKQEMRDAGMDSVLSKPFSINDLVDRIREVADKPLYGRML